MGTNKSDVNSPTILSDWDSLDDPDNPRNWPPRLKIFHGACVAGAAFVCNFEASVLTPSFDAAAADLRVSRELTILAYAIYILGLAFGAPVAGPLSETIGRRYVYWSSIPIFAAFTIGAGFSQNIASLIVQRFFAAFFGASSLTIGSITIADIWVPEERTWPMAIYVATPFLAPSIAPLIGAVVTEYLSWRWTSWTVLFVGVLSFFLVAPFMRETYKNAILEDRAKKRGVLGPLTAASGKSGKEVMSNFVRRGLARPIHMYLTEPVVTAFVTYVAFTFALLYAFYAAFQTVYPQYYGFGLIQVGLTFLAIGVGVMMGVVVAILFHHLQYKPKLRQLRDDVESKVSNSTSKLAPEHRLPQAMVGGVLLTTGLFLFGWSVASHRHWIAPVIGEVLFGTGTLLVFMGATQYMVDTYGPLYGASAQGASTLLRYLLGFSFPLFAVQMFDGLGVQWACTLLGCLSAIGMSIPFVLFHWGPALRSRTKYRIDM